MTIVKANLKDIAKVPVGDGTLTYTRYNIRPDGTSATGLTTPSAITVPIVAGIANSPDLDPGRYELEISVGWFVETITIEIPQATDVQLRTLIALAAGIPEETSAEKFQAALTEYFLANPVEGGGGGLTVEQIAAAAESATPLQTAVDARAKVVGDQNYAPAARALPTGGSAGQVPVKTA
ncbi:hypothetical protein ACTHQY_08855, partial [Rhodococcoides corynebacterioides]|uniref:hypothetical protein n=1 Tax=Rhodococcoides corynebacterioides TaxID=53972 RepID=UPI003F7E84E2